MRKGTLIAKLLSLAVFVCLEIAAVSLIRHNSPLQDRWLSKAGHAVRMSVWGATEKWADYFSLSRKNDTLAQKNTRLLEELYRANALIEDIRRDESVPLREADGRYSFIFARVAKISSNSQHNYFILDRGADAGIETGDGVITSRGAVGIIEAVSRHYSYAISFENHEMTVSARLGRDGAVGPLSWDGKSGNTAILKDIPRHLDINMRDTVYTSGFSYIFPPDIPLGVPTEMRLRDGATYDITVRLFENIGSMRYVAVVKDRDKVEISDLEGAAQ